MGPLQAPRVVSLEISLFTYHLYIQVHCSLHAVNIENEILGIFDSILTLVVLSLLDCL